MSSANVSFPLSNQPKRISGEKMVVWCSVAAETRGKHAVNLPLTRIKLPVPLKSFLPVTPASLGDRQSLEAAGACWAHPMKGLLEGNAKYCAQLIKSCQSPQKKAGSRQRSGWQLNIWVKSLSRHLGLCHAVCYRFSERNSLSSSSIFGIFVPHTTCLIFSYNLVGLLSVCGLRFPEYNWNLKHLVLLHIYCVYTDFGNIIISRFWNSLYFQVT